MFSFWFFKNIYRQFSGILGKTFAEKSSTSFSYTMAWYCYLWPLSGVAVYKYVLTIFKEHNANSNLVASLIQSGIGLKWYPSALLKRSLYLHCLHIYFLLIFLISVSINLQLQKSHLCLALFISFSTPFSKHLICELNFPLFVN